MFDAILRLKYYNVNKLYNNDGKNPIAGTTMNGINYLTASRQ